MGANSSVLGCEKPERVFFLVDSLFFWFGRGKKTRLCLPPVCWPKKWPAGKIPTDS